MPWSALPEEIVHHIDDLPRVDIHQQRVVVIADPLQWPRRGRQIVHVRICQPVVLPVLGRPKPPADIVPLISPAERIVVNANPEDRPVMVTIVAPIVAMIVPPVGTPL